MAIKPDCPCDECIVKATCYERDEGDQRNICNKFLHYYNDLLLWQCDINREAKKQDRMDDIKLVSLVLIAIWAIGEVMSNF